MTRLSKHVPKGPPVRTRGLLGQWPSLIDIGFSRLQQNKLTDKAFHTVDTHALHTVMSCIYIRYYSLAYRGHACIVYRAVAFRNLWLPSKFAAILIPTMPPIPLQPRQAEGWLQGHLKTKSVVLHPPARGSTLCQSPRGIPARPPRWQYRLTRAARTVVVCPPRGKVALVTSLVAFTPPRLDAPCPPSRG